MGRLRAPLFYRRQPQAVGLEAMSTCPFSDTDEQFERLRELYGDERAQATRSKIESLLATYRERVDVSGDAGRLNEKDVLLITYGDTLTQRGVAPLQVLRDGQFRLSLGTPGSYGILQTTAQMLVAISSPSSTPTVITLLTGMRRRFRWDASVFGALTRMATGSFPGRRLKRPRGAS